MRLKVILAALVGFGAGAILIAALGSGGSGSPDAEATATDPSTTSTASTTSVLPAATPTSSSVPDGDRISTDYTIPVPDTLLVWTSGGLPPGFAEAVAELDTIGHTSVVSGDHVGLVASVAADGDGVEHLTDGWTIPLDVLALDPDAHVVFEPTAEAAFAALVPGSALLTETSAGLRGVDAGATLVLVTGEVKIAAVLPDVPGVGAELIVHADDAARLGVDRQRYLLVEHTGDREAAQSEIDAVLTRLDAAQAIRFRSRPETTWLRHGDAVLPAALVKARFGEFAIRDAAGRSVEISPDWVDDHIVTAEVPILGEVRCHADLIEPLATALGALADAGLAHLVDPGEFGGCFVPRRIDAGLPLSRHSWGIAVDINVGDNPRGSFATQDPALVDALHDVGMGWGGTWLVPDPAHYEAIDLR